MSLHRERAITIRNWLIVGTLIAYGVAVAAHMIAVPALSIEVSAETVQTTATPVAAASTHANVKKVAASEQSAEGRVRTYFSDIPVLVDIARCESHFRQFDASGKVTRGVINPADVGVMQINEYYHKDTAEKLNLDLGVLDDNLAYARYLYERDGTQPWSASRACWQRTPDTTLAMQ